MNRTNISQLVCWVFLVALIAVLVSSCIPQAPTVYMKMNPPADSDKPLPVPADDGSCWLHTASNMLAGAGYGSGTTLQDRADDIWNDMDAEFREASGGYDGGWTDTALQWWLGSANNIWNANPYTVVTVHGNKKPPNPWANTNGARDIANELRACNMVGLSISWPTGSGGERGHALTTWGDDNTTITALNTNPGGVRLTDSDTDDSGDVQDYTYDAYTNPNPGGKNEGDGWYFNYDPNHPYIKHIVTLTPTDGPSGPDSVRVLGSYKIHQDSQQPANDLHYRVGANANILTYRTWLDWDGTPTITEAQPRDELTVDWDLAREVPQSYWVTINTEFVERAWNAIAYNDVHFNYNGELIAASPDLSWMIETPWIDKAELIPNVTGGYVTGSFEVLDPESPDEPAAQYRLVHQYLYNQSPELHTFLITGTPGFVVTNLNFGHSYGYPTEEELWRFENWMTKVEEQYTLGEEPIVIILDWKGQLPYPEGDRGANDGKTYQK